MEVFTYPSTYLEYTNKVPSISVFSWNRRNSQFKRLPIESQEQLWTHYKNIWLISQTVSLVIIEICWKFLMNYDLNDAVRPNFSLNTLRPGQHGRYFADDTFKRIFLNENIIISTKISLQFVTKCLINNIQALVQIMAWRQPGDKPLSEAMMVRLMMHICVTRPQCVKAVSTRK